MQNLLDREGLRRCRAVRPARVGVFAFAFVVAWLQADAVVFRPGASEIVIAPDACDTVLLAAEEASEFMGKSLGRDVPIVRSPSPSRSSLYIGPSKWAEAAGVTTNGLKRDGFRIMTKGPSKICLRLYNATGEVWYDNVRIEEMD